MTTTQPANTVRTIQLRETIGDLPDDLQLLRLATEHALNKASAATENIWSKHHDSLKKLNSLLLTDAQAAELNSHELQVLTIAISWSDPEQLATEINARALSIEQRQEDMAQGRAADPYLQRPTAEHGFEYSPALMEQTMQALVDKLGAAADQL